MAPLVILLLVLSFCRHAYAQGPSVATIGGSMEVSLCSTCTFGLRRNSSTFCDLTPTCDVLAEVEASAAALAAVVATKAGIVAVNGLASDVSAAIVTLNTAKAEATSVAALSSALASNSASAAAVTATKADKTYVDGQNTVLSTQLSSVSAVLTTAAPQSTVTLVNTSLVLQLQATQASVATKANIVDNAAVSSGVASLAVVVGTKADKTYVDSQLAATNSQLSAASVTLSSATATKAAQSSLDLLNSTVASQVQSLASVAATKADTTTVVSLSSALAAASASAAIISNIKADKTYVDGQNNALATQLSSVTVVLTTVAPQSAVSSLNTSLAQQMQAVQSALATKANVSDNTVVGSGVASLAVVVGAKADKTYVDSQIAATNSQLSAATVTLSSATATRAAQASLDSLNSTIAVQLSNLASVAATKADSTTLTSLSTSVVAATASAATVTATKADRTYVDAQTASLGAQIVAVNVSLSSGVATRASQSSLDSFNGTMTAALQGLSGAVATRANSSALASVSAAVVAAASSINAVNSTVANKANTLDLMTTNIVVNSLQNDYATLKAAMLNCTLQNMLLNPSTLACVSAIDLSQPGSLAALFTNVSKMIACQSRVPPTVFDGRTGDCSTGFVLQDINECATSNGGCGQICTNTIGSFVCSCQSGYKLDTNARSCSDINECATNNGGCSSSASCANTLGAFLCNCLPGFTGNGVTCTACAANSYKSANDNTACIACPADAVTSAASSTSLSQCFCPIGFTGSASTGAACTACAVGTYKSTTGSAACLACSFGYTTSGVGSTAVSQCNQVYWVQVGTLGTYDTVLSTYSQLNFEFGVQYNGDIQVVFANGWNSGTRVTTYPFFPQNDGFNAQSFGTVVFTRGVSGAPDLTNWYHYYYQVSATGIGAVTGSNGVSNTIPMFVRPLLSSWFQAGTLNSLSSIRAAYPDATYEIGLVYNGWIQRAFVNSWNVGTRVSAYPLYPQGDTATSFTFGTVVFTRGLTGSASSTTWYHLYFTYPSNYYSSNGDGGGTTLYVRPHLNAWASAGQLSNIGSIMSTYSPMSFEYGIAYNGDIQTVLVTTWNQGTRVTLYPFFPMGDSNNGMTFGTVVLAQALQNLPDNTNFYQSYYYMNTGGGYSDTYAWSNGQVNTLTVYYRALKFPWVTAGQLSNIATIRQTYPGNMYELGLAYNGNMVQTAFRNGWNVGSRISLSPIYPQGDDAQSLNFGTVVFSQGLNGAPTSSDWYTAYYRFPDTYIGAGTSANVNALNLYVRPYYQHVHSTSWGV